MSEKNQRFKFDKRIIFGIIAVISTIIIMIIVIPRISDLNSNNSNTETPEITNIYASKAYEMINDADKYPNLLILDVRTQEEYDSGHINNSILIPYDEIESRIDEIIDHKDLEIIIYCQSGSRSQIASQILIDNNFSKVYNMLGGFNTWDDADYPIIS